MKLSERFENLRDNYSPAGAIEFSQVVLESSIDEVLENVTAIVSEPLRGPETLFTYLVDKTISPEYLQESSNSLLNLINDMTIYNANEEHIEQVKECVDLINAKIKTTKNVSLVDFIMENAYMDNLEISSSRKKVNKVLIKDLNKDDAAQILKLVDKTDKSIGGRIGQTGNNIHLLSKATTLILYSTITLTAIALETLTVLPIAIVTKYIDTKLTKADTKLYIRAFKTEIDKIDAAAIISGNSEDRTYAIQYRKNLEIAISKLESNLDNKYYLKTDEILKESTEDAIEHLCLEYTENYLNLSLNNLNDDESIICLENMMRSINSYNNIMDNFTEIVTEAKGKNVRQKVSSGIHKASKVGRKVSKNLKKAGDSMGTGANELSKVPKKIDDKVNDNIDKAKQRRNTQLREDIIEGKDRIQLTRIVKKGITVGTVAMINPALAAIGVLTSLALSKRLKEKEKNKILFELETELRIVEEKIEDSKGNGDNEKKYQLMRLKNKLEKDIKRIKFNLSKFD